MVKLPPAESPAANSHKQPQTQQAGKTRCQHQQNSTQTHAMHDKECAHDAKHFPGFASYWFLGYLHKLPAAVAVETLPAISIQSPSLD
jgi:hypothetical protein